MSIKNKQEMIEKKYGKGKAQWLGSNNKVVYDFDTVSSGSLYLDKKLGQGFPKLTIAEIIGEEQSGKTTLCLNTIAEAQRKYPKEYCAFVDVEHALDAKYAQSVGVDLSRLIISQPDSAEEALMIAEDFIRDDECGVVVIDSIAGLVPEAELDKELNEEHVSKLPIILGRAARKMKNLVRPTGTLVVFTNQFRITQFIPFVKKDTPGGRAMRFFAGIRIILKRSTTLIKADVDGAPTNIGQVCTAHIKKNKFNAPFCDVDFYIMFGKGISKEDELIDLGVEMGIIGRAGSWFSYGDFKIQGRTGMLQHLMENKKLTDEIEKKAKEYLFNE